MAIQGKPLGSPTEGVEQAPTYTGAAPDFNSGISGATPDFNAGTTPASPTALPPWGSGTSGSIAPPDPNQRVGGGFGPYDAFPGSTPVPPALGGGSLWDVNIGTGIAPQPLPPAAGGGLLADLNVGTGTIAPGQQFSPTPVPMTPGTPGMPVNPVPSIPRQRRVIRNRGIMPVAKTPLASYEKGTDKVPETGIYKLHKGEAVIPASKNPANKPKSEPKHEPRKAAKRSVPTPKPARKAAKSHSGPSFLGFKGYK